MYNFDNKDKFATLCLKMLKARGFTTDLKGIATLELTEYFKCA